MRRYERAIILYPLPCAGPDCRMYAVDASKMLPSTVGLNNSFTVWEQKKVTLSNGLCNRQASHVGRITRRRLKIRNPKSEQSV
jgi:hypothetical protein